MQKKALSSLSEALTVLKYAFLHFLQVYCNVFSPRPYGDCSVLCEWTPMQECQTTAASLSAQARSGAQAPCRTRLGWSAGALDHVLSPHTGSFHLYITGECFALPFFYQIKSLCNCTSAAPEPLVPQSKRSTASGSDSCCRPLEADGATFCQTWWKRYRGRGGSTRTSPAAKADFSWCDTLHPSEHHAAGEMQKVAHGSATGSSMVPETQENPTGFK